MQGEAALPAAAANGTLARGGRRTARLLRWVRRPLTLGSLVVLTIFTITAALAPAIAPFGRNEATSAYFASPGLAHVFGTDNLGRDVFSRVVYGARVSLEVGVLSVLMGTLVGAVLGTVSAYAGGWADAAFRRLVDLMMSLPSLLLALVIAAGLGASLFNVTLAISAAIVPVAGRIARSSTLVVRELPYVEAARTLGANPARVVTRHVVPNVLAPVVVIASVQFGFAIISEASLSFLGLGVPLGVPSWGNMLSGSTLLYMQRAPWMGLFPGLALTLVVMAVNLFGDSLRDFFDPRLRGR